MVHSVSPTRFAVSLGFYGLAGLLPISMGVKVGADSKKCLCRAIARGDLLFLPHRSQTRESFANERQLTPA